MRTFYNFIAGFLFGLFLMHAHDKLRRPKPPEWTSIPANRQNGWTTGYTKYVQFCDTNKINGWIVVSNSSLSRGYAYPAAY